MTNYPGIFALSLPVCALLVSCGNAEPAKAHTPARADWKIQSRVDVRHGTLEAGKYVLIAPFVLGDRFGGPNSKSYVTIQVRDDGTFELDLNQGHDAMLAELAGHASKRFVDNRMSIAPGDARIATLSPEIVDHRFSELGMTNWADGQGGRRLQLMYFDRPARLTGHNFDVEVTEAGYVWVEEPPAPGIAHAVPQPEALVLAFHRK